MKRMTIFGLALAATLFAATSQATTYQVHAYDDHYHAVWLPGLDQRYLLLDAGSTLSIEADEWKLEGGLTSSTDTSKWSISVTFSGVMTGPNFGVLTGYDNTRIKGTGWGNIQSDWAFAQTVTGTLTAIDGDWAGHTFSLARNPGHNDYWAQFGTCMNDKNCDKGLSTWLTLTDDATGNVYTGDINARVSAPVPEPSAALIFGLGSIVSSAAIRRRKP